MGKRSRKVEEIERLLPTRLRGEPKAGDNPLKRPYPEHSRDIEILAELMSELPKDPPEYEFSKRDQRIPIRPHGVIYFHALDIQNLVLSKNNFVRGSPFCVYVELECQDTVKCSDPVYATDLRKVRVDHAIHMCIELSEVRSDEKNDFLMHIYAFQDAETHYLIGSQVIHLYEFVREIHGISSIDMINELSFTVGKFTFEFAWCYGSFGYGFSNQLRNSKNSIFESLSHSMFPRIKLSPDDLVDNKVKARIPKRLRLITLHSLLVRRARNKEKEPSEKAGIQIKKSKHAKEQTNSADYEAKTIVFRRVKFSRGTPVHVYLNLDIHQKFMEDDFNHAYGEYICLRNRKDRLSWLTRLVEGRLRDRVEYDVGEIFMPYNDADEARRVLTQKRPLGCPPGYLEHNPAPERRCGPIAPVNVEEEDLKLIKEKLASAPRFSGYLAYVFGYMEAPDEDINLENFEYKVDPKLGEVIEQKVKDGRSTLKRIKSSVHFTWFRIKSWCTSAWAFVFPSFQFDAAADDVELPEISLTMPSPQHSTTDFHSFCTQQQVFDVETDLDLQRRRAATYLHMSRKGGTGVIGLDAEGDFLVPSKTFMGETSGNENQKRERNLIVMDHADTAKLADYSTGITGHDVRNRHK